MENFPEIPGYQLIRQIGEGKTARVFLGRGENPDREVAIKVLKPEFQNDKQYYYRFQREAKITAEQLSHPGIIKIYHFGKSNVYYIVMEYVDVSLNDKLTYGIGLREKEIIKIFKKIASALHYAHSMGFIHRDIKPANILLRRGGTPVLTDFGLARDVESQTGLTETGMIMGTPHYMSPEQIKALSVDNRSDIYSMGVVLYQMLTGELPYRGNSSAIIYNQHINSPIPKLPPELKRYQPLINRMMAKEKQKRARSVREAGLMLEKIYHKGVPPPIDTGEVLAHRDNFFRKHKKWLLAVLLVLATLSLMVVIVMIVMMVQKVGESPIGNNQTQKNPPIINHIDFQNLPVVYAVENTHKAGVPGKRSQA